MRKFLSILLSLTLLISIFKVNNVKAATNDEQKILSVITGYLEHYLSLQKDLKVTNNNYIYPNSKLSEFYTLSSNSMAKWYSSTFGQLDWFDLEVKINSIEDMNDFLIVNVDEIVKGQYIGVNDLTKYEVNHTLYLKYYNDELLVERDILTVESSNNKSNTILSDKEYNKYIDEKIEIEKEKSVNLESEIDKVNEPTINSDTIEDRSATFNSGNYNRWAAKQYAIDYAYGSEDYQDYDCTNFVSKALKVGGLPTDETWYPGSYAWIRVIALRDYLISSGRAKEDYMYLDNSDIGDIIQLFNSDEGYWSHSVIVTGALGNARLVSAHSVAAKNVNFSSYYPGKSFYSNYRVLRIVY